MKTTRKRAVRAPTGDVSLRGDGGVVQANGSSGDGSLGNGEHILCIMGVCCKIFFFVCVCVATFVPKTVSLLSNIFRV